jgi:hypothetical protein
VKWLSRDWHQGRLSDAQSEEVEREYSEHVAALRPRLSDGAAELLDLSLHDGQVQTYNRSADSFEWRILVGDLQRGYEIVTLRYDDAEVVGGQSGLDNLNLPDREIELLYDELEVLPDSRLVHRVLVWPEGEVWVRFSQVHVDREGAKPDARR